MPITDTARAEIIRSVHTLIDECYDYAREAGFYDADTEILTILDTFGEREDVEKAKILIMLTRIMLIVSEAGEACEAVRHGNPPSDHIPQYDNLTEELADIIIRVLDLAGHLGLPLGAAILAKMEFNKTRGHMHGKKA